ncbi:LytR C-terminal domain-containing protein [Streptomyces sp. H10-C2]|uniref:LytR C-terminal domain-containing protein n=1 Tax=unclassified Streptomyces TaxID=2593676 RepID=UPI0024B9764E|nr:MULTISPECIES: LytR C-terminal domain-containing protein [unclassified Streptomyces]MDJ0342128.1 LytR C-terminal domain-containing protein [Streptomyces sp. PH10-H1]MDJ0368470.1 LytR C-terminal domain-containing protein [Streptomyces sp. H10-C2]
MAHYAALMSMLTPSGMGGKYRITGNQYPRMGRPKRRGRTALAIVASVVVLGLIGWGTLQLIDVFTGDGKDKVSPQAHAAAPPSCKPTATPTPSGKPAPLPKPATIGLNVFNATAKGGLAKTTADELAKRGFRVGKFGNAPIEYDKKVKDAALVVAGPAAEQAARVVGTQVAGSTVRIDPKRTDPGVDLLIGTAYTKLADPKDVEKALVAAAAPPAKASPGC